MRKKKYGILLPVLIMLLLLITGCGRQEDAAVQEDDAQTPATPPVEMPERKEILIKEFPFEGSYALSLFPLPEEDGVYELRLFDTDSKQILQQISCEGMEDPELSYYKPYAVYNGNDRKMIGISNEDGSISGYEWDGERFSENDSIVMQESDGGVVMEYEDTYETTANYEYNEDLGYMEETRRMTLQTDTGEIKIEDYVTGECLFEGTAKMITGGILINQKYYDKLFWDELYYWSGEEPYIDCWSKGEDGEEHIEVYNKKDTLLSEFGLKSGVTTYQYYSENHNLRMELFADESVGRFCGIIYDGFSYNRLGENRAEYTDGFILEETTEEVWKAEDVYAIMEEFEAEAKNPGKNCMIDKGYIFDELPDSYLVMDKDTAKVLMGIDYTYREDGTLFYRRYFRGDAETDDDYSERESYYDEKERVVYEYRKGKEGWQTDYYVYTDEGEKPAYHLNIVYGKGMMFTPYLTKYR